MKSEVNPSAQILRGIRPKVFRLSGASGDCVSMARLGSLVTTCTKCREAREPDEWVFHSESYLSISLITRRGLTPIQKLRTGNNGFHQRGDSILVRHRAFLHQIDDRFVRKLQGPIQRVGQ